MKKIITIVLLFSLILISLGILVEYNEKEIDKKIMCLNIKERVFILENEANIKEKTKSEEEIKTIFNVIGFFHHRTLKPYNYTKIDDKNYDIFYKDNNFDMNIEKCKNYEVKYSKDFNNLIYNLKTKKDCFNINIINNYFEIRKENFNNIEEINDFISKKSGNNYEKLFNLDMNNKPFKYIKNNDEIDIINSNNLSKNKNCINKNK